MKTNNLFNNNQIELYGPSCLNIDNYYYMISYPLTFFKASNCSLKGPKKNHKQTKQTKQNKAEINKQTKCRKMAASK